MLRASDITAFNKTSPNKRSLNIAIDESPELEDLEDGIVKKYLQNSEDDQNVNSSQGEPAATGESPDNCKKKVIAKKKRTNSILQID